jgi:hypothetical protein
MVDKEQIKPCLPASVLFDFPLPLAFAMAQEKQINVESR